MTPNSRKTSNGRSPLVNPQRQITSFFSKRSSSSPSPSPSSIPCDKDNADEKASPNPSSITPIISRKKKTLLITGGETTVPSANPRCKYGKEVIGRKLLVYWPLDKCWYEGRVHSYDSNKGKHCVKYNDGDEELLDLENEKIEWVEEKQKMKRGVKYIDSDEELLDKENENIEGCNDNNGKEHMKHKDIDEEILELDDKKSEGFEEKKKLKRLRRGTSSSKVEEGINANDLVPSTRKNELRDESPRVNRPRLRSDDDDDYHVSLVDRFESDEELRNNSGKTRKLSSGKMRVKSDDENSENRQNKSVKNEMNSLVSIVPVNITEGQPRNCLEKMVIDDAGDRFVTRDDEKLPFLGKNRRDAKKRAPGDDGYDPRTLYLPPEFVKGLSSGQRQWWEFKSKHMDKILFFKMGKFYELFEMDAHVGAKELNLQYMKGEQPHCGFPEKNFSFNIEKLARKGYRVLVVEQTETPEQLEIRRKESGSKDKVVKREICAVVTKGTLTEGQLLSGQPDASYLMAIVENISIEVETTVGVCFVDVATNRVILGQFVDDAERSLLCSILSEMRPVEIVKPAESLSADTEKVLQKHTRSPLVNELIPDSEFWTADKTVRELKSSYKFMIHQPDAESPTTVEEDKSHSFPEPLQKLFEMNENGRLAISALGGALFYLKQAFLDQTLIKFANFELLSHQNPINASQKQYMVLDAAALENLEIFENTRNGDSSGTLYKQLNHCVTAFGKRLLKAWLARPLYHAKSIRDRQVAISCFRGANQSVTLDFRKSLARLPDMERLLARVYASSGANGRHANKVVLYEDAAKRQLKDFISCLHGCESMNIACYSLSLVLKGSADSQLLHDLLTSGFRSVQGVLKFFKDAFDWDDANSLGRIIPRKGVDDEYDSACEKLEEIESNLQRHLKEEQKRFKNAAISYVTVGKETHLLEIPEHLRGSVPADFELRSSRKGFYRYWNPEIKRFLKDMSSADTEKETALRSILQRLIEQFSKHHDDWRKLTSVVAELDVLTSLSIANEFFEGPSCHPIISDSRSLYAKSLGHPMLRSDTLTKGSFVPNDIGFGGSCSDFILLTGPNMGGKSTLLRQVCLAVILAQIGADVPAESFELSPVDRIFVRMGAKDHIMAGQSTFFNELSETASMLNSATRNSLVALDEFGRGTSTSDGQAIADAVLDYLVHNVECRGMFSTHYHRLALQFENDPKVSVRHMACQVERAGDVEEVTFLYRLADGGCPKSYGVNVARLAGLPDSVLQRAALKSTEFEATYAAAIITKLNRMLSLTFPSLLQLRRTASLLAPS